MCSSDPVNAHAFPAMLKRVQQMRQLINVAGKNVHDSVALNDAEETATRMHNNPQTAAAELAGFRSQVT